MSSLSSSSIYIALLLAAMSFAKDGPVTLQGEVADSQCALNVHSLTRSHREMLKSKNMGSSPAACASYCVKYLGGEYVLSTPKEVYRLDTQAALARFAGQSVKVTGLLNTKTKSIQVLKIETMP
jgi:hypothetical protein